MKKVLFIIGNLQSGGVSKSIVNLLNTFDRENYNVSLYITNTDSDVFSQFLPSNITILTNQDTSDLLAGTLGLKRLLLRGHIVFMLFSLIRMLLSFVSKPIMGKWLSMIMPLISDTEYDMIIDYNGQHQLYYMVNRLKGKKKVTFFHNDYSKWPFYYKMDKIYYPKVDKIFSISQVCVDALKEYFPSCVDKIALMENISSSEVIQELSKENLQENVALAIKDENTDIVLASLGHFCKRKGSDLAIKAGSILKEKGIHFKWIFVGKIIEKDLLTDVEAAGLMDSFIFTGVQANPYPYIKAADIYVHPSRFEGKSIALDEAKILCKPIIVTNFSTVQDQFENRINASICEMNGESLALAIEELISKQDLREAYSTFLKNHFIDNRDEVSKLYQLL